MIKKISAYKIYLLYSGITALLFSLVTTVMIVYHIENVHMNPLQLILVGTVLEAVCFTFEIPTGIVADVYGVTTVNGKYCTVRVNKPLNHRKF